MRVPAVFPPVVMVSFDAQRASAESIMAAAKFALETDPLDDLPVTATLESGPVSVAAALDPIQRFAAADLWAHNNADGTVRLGSELLSCGTCANQVVVALQGTPGVLEASSEGDFRTGVFINVRYDPAATDSEAIAGVVKGALESDNFLPTSVAVHFLED